MSTQTKWDYTNDGYEMEKIEDGMTIRVSLEVGHGLPETLNHTEGRAVMSISKPNNMVITERILFSSHPDFRGKITGEFISADGMDVGDSWDIDNIELIDPSTMDDGDERNDDMMKAFIEKHVKCLVYEDELQAAQSENFCIVE